MIGTLNGGEDEDPWRDASRDLAANDLQAELLREMGFGPFNAATRDPQWHLRARNLAPHVSVLAVAKAMESNPHLLLYEN